jgi:hypothetical protein
MNKEHGLGWLLGLIVLAGIGMFIVFLIFTRAIYAFGIFGAFILLAVVLLIFGWVYDRRLDKKYPDEID